MQRVRVVADRQECEIGAGPFSQVVVRRSCEAAVGVLHDDHCVDAEHVTRHGQAPKNVIGHSSPGVSDDMGLTELQAERGEDIDTGIHARDDGEVADWDVGRRCWL